MHWLRPEEQAAGSLHCSLFYATLEIMVSLELLCRWQTLNFLLNEGSLRSLEDLEMSVRAVIQGRLAFELSLLQSKPLHVMINLGLILYSPVNTQGRCLAQHSSDNEWRWGSGACMTQLCFVGPCGPPDQGHEEQVFPSSYAG